MSDVIIFAIPPCVRTGRVVYRKVKAVFKRIFANTRHALGMVMEDKLLHHENASRPMLVMLLETMTEVRLLQLLI